MRFRIVTGLIVLGAAALVFVLIGPGGPADPGSTGIVTVRMIDNAFSPPVIRLPVGGTVRFVNRGQAPHNAVGVGGDFSTETSFGDLEMPEDAVADLVFPEAGVFRYLCTFHATPDGREGMVGRLLVGDVEDLAEDDGGRLAAVADPSGQVRRVPGEYPTIQNAVDAAAPGDLVLIAPGVYREEVVVTTPSLVIRGLSRNRVILDGEFERGNGIMAIGADGVAVENMTARHYRLNGFFWSGVKGYRGSYLTAYNSGDYGIYAFASVDGLFERSYASGHPDSGFYIGQCDPCRAVLDRNIAEHNGLAYSGTNSGGELYLVRNLFQHNMAGVVPNTLDSELLPPQRRTTIVGNIITANNDLASPATPATYAAYGNGIVIAGGVANDIARNRISGHRNHGVLITANLDQNFWFARWNQVLDNVIGGSGRADLALTGPMSTGNCFAGNRFRSSIPPLLEQLQGCSGLRFPLGQDLSTAWGTFALVVEVADGDFPHGDWRHQPVPPAQPEMPEPAAPGRPAVDVFAALAFDIDRVPLPGSAREMLK